MTKEFAKKHFFVFAFIIATSCSLLNKKSHRVLETGGFYFRNKNKDKFECLRFYSNGRVQSMDILFKKDSVRHLYNGLCIQDSALTKFSAFRDMGTYTRKKDSLEFTFHTFSYLTPYNRLYRLRVYKDSLVGKIIAADLDTTRIRNMPSINAVFRFIRATCDTTINFPKMEYDVDPPRLFRDTLR